MTSKNNAKNLVELESRVREAFTNIEKTLSYKQLLDDCFHRGRTITTLSDADQRKIIFAYFLNEVPPADRGEVFFEGLMQQSIDKVAVCCALGEIQDKDAADWLYLRIKEYSLPYIENDFEELEQNYAG